MAMRSFVGKLKALSPRMPRSGAAAAAKDVMGYQRRPLTDPTKYGSIKELNEALPSLLDERIKAEQEAFDRYLKAYNRVTYVTTGAGFGLAVLLHACVALWFFDTLLEDDRVDA